MNTRTDFSTLLYVHARDLRLSRVFYEPNEVAQMQALQRWLTGFGCCAIVTVAMLEGCQATSNWALPSSPARLGHGTKRFRQRLKPSLQRF